MAFRIALIAFLFFPLISCTDNDVEKTSMMTVNMTYHFGEQDFQSDTIKYEISSGDSISITRMEYYLSNFEFHSSEGWTSADNYFYMNALEPDMVSIEVPASNYDSLRFVFGLSQKRNKTYALDPLPHNVKMAWPDVMGGGYHFMKLEGHFLNERKEYQGYALHMGTSVARRTHLFAKEIDISADEHQLELTMDLGSWFQDPFTFDLNSGLNYTMGVDSLMSHLANNGLGSIKVVDFK